MLVIGRHSVPCPEKISPFLHALTNAWLRAGWIGVDLFFVLSGFLISGLLIREYHERGTISVKRFYIRRGFKIYPAFFFFLSVTAIVALIRYAKVLHPADAERFWSHFWNWIWPNLLFVQNYVGMPESTLAWSLRATWTLAVEEHFYLVMPLIMVVLLRTRKPFVSLIILFLAVAAICLIARCMTIGGFSTWRNQVPTHLRIDALFFGVILSCLKHFRPSSFIAIQKYSTSLCVLGAMILCPVIFLEISTTRYLYTIGFTQIYLGCGILLIGMLGAGFGSGGLGRAMAFIGARSYSIYLWHIPAAWITSKIFTNLGGLDDWLALSAVYFLGTLVLGISMFYLVENPILGLRDRFYRCESEAGLNLGGVRTGRP